MTLYTGFVRDKSKLDAIGMCICKLVASCLERTINNGRSIFFTLNFN